MHSHDDRIQMREREFREVCVEALNSSNQTQQQLADLAGVHQCTIARWFAYTGDPSIPAYILGTLPSNVVLPILSFLAHKHGYNITPAAVPAGALNGKLEDEELDLAAELGRLIESAKKTDKRRMLRVLDQMMVLVSRAKSEIYSMP
jgi:hypothetical protein